MPNWCIVSKTDTKNRNPAISVSNIVDSRLTCRVMRSEFLLASCQSYKSAKGIAKPIELCHIRPTLIFPVEAKDLLYASYLLRIITWDAKAVSNSPPSLFDSLTSLKNGVDVRQISTVLRLRLGVA